MDIIFYATAQSELLPVDLGAGTYYIVWRPPAYGLLSLAVCLLPKCCTCQLYDQLLAHLGNKLID